MKDIDKKTAAELYSSLQYAYENNLTSISEGDEVENMYHNRQYDAEQLALLQKRGQPKETFNVIKLFTRTVVGYYATVVNEARASAKQQADVLTALVLSDIMKHTFRYNDFEVQGDFAKIDGLLRGLMCIHEEVIETGEVDDFGRPRRRILLTNVPASEVFIDPLSRKYDCTDASFIHRVKRTSIEWVELAIKNAGHSKKKTEILMNNVVNTANKSFSVFEERYTGETYKDGERSEYDLVHSVLKDTNNRTFSYLWCGDVIIEKKDISRSPIPFPYRLQKVHQEEDGSYYGIFREIKESQKAINQALIKIQLLANTAKHYVEDMGVRDIDQYEEEVNSVNAIVRVNSLAGIKIEKNHAEITSQYVIIDKALDRIKMVLGVNDSFLGLAFASDSGRKVKLLQNATILSLRYLTTRIEAFYKKIGYDICELARRYYTSQEAFRISDNAQTERWVEVNKPLERWTGAFDENGLPIMETVFEEVIDFDTGKPMIDEQGNYIIAPVPRQETEIAFSDVDIEIESVAYNDEPEKNQLMLETILQGNIGAALMRYNPQGFFKAASYSIKTVRTKNSLDIAKVLEETSKRITDAEQQQAMVQELLQRQQQSEDKQRGTGADNRIPRGDDLDRRDDNASTG